MRFVSPETVRIDLSNGDWIVVKKELTVGEDRKFRASGLRNVSQPGLSPEIAVDWAAMSLARVEAYLTDWSATKADGKRIPLTRAAIEGLSAESFDAIDAAVIAHIEASAQEKKETTGASSSTEALG